MIYARHNGKDRLMQRIQAANLALLSDAEFLRAVSKTLVAGTVLDEAVADAVAARLLSIAMKCEAKEEASE